MSKHGIEALRQATREAVEVQQMVMEAAALRVEAEMLQAIEILMMRFACLSDAARGSSALDALARPQRDTLNAPVLAYVNRSLGEDGRILTGPAAIDLQSGKIAIEGETIAVLAMFQTIEDIAKLLGEEPARPVVVVNDEDVKH